MQQFYEQMWQNALRDYHKGQFEYDAYLNGREDTRRGITLLARPDEATRQNIVQFLHEFSQLEPEQYCHPESDLHITIMSIIACKEHYQLSNEQQYCAAVQSIVNKVNAFDVKFSGITASPNCVLVRGFTQDNSLHNLRNSIRQAFNNSSLAHSMDTRYAIKTAHSSVIRYRQPFKDPATTIDFLKSNKERFFGNFKIDELELVLNDWYQRNANTKVLAKYSLA